MDFSRHCNSTSHKEAVRHHEEQLMHNTIVEEDLHQSKETQKQQADEDQAKAKQLAKGKKHTQKRKYTEELVEINPGQTTREMEVKQKKQEDQVRVQQTDVEPPQEMTAVGAEEKSQEGGTTEEKQGQGKMRVDSPDQAGGTEGNSSQDSEIGDAIAAKLKKALLNVIVDLEDHVTESRELQGLGIDEGQSLLLEQFEKQVKQRVIADMTVLIRETWLRKTQKLPEKKEEEEERPAPLLTAEETGSTRPGSPHQEIDRLKVSFETNF